MAWRQQFLFFFYSPLLFHSYLYSLDTFPLRPTTSYETWRLSESPQHTIHISFAFFVCHSKNNLLFCLFHLGAMYRTNQGLEIKQGRPAFTFMILVHMCHFFFFFFCFFPTFYDLILLFLSCLSYFGHLYHWDRLLFFSFRFFVSMLSFCAWKERAGNHSDLIPIFI
jgi:hypothetical protein